MVLRSFDHSSSSFVRVIATGCCASCRAGQCHFCHEVHAEGRCMALLAGFRLARECLCPSPEAPPAEPGSSFPWQCSGAVVALSLFREKAGDHGFPEVRATTIVWVRGRIRSWILPKLSPASIQAGAGEGWLRTRTRSCLGLWCYGVCSGQKFLSCFTQAIRLIFKELVGFGSREAS